MLPRNVAAGRALDAALKAAAKPPVIAASSPAAVASSPAMAASGPALVASSPAKTTSQPVEEVISPLPQPVASAPAVKTSAPSAVAPVAVDKITTTKNKNVVPRIKSEKLVKPQKTTKAPARKEPDEERFYLNVGLFADDNNARNAHVKLVDAGLPSVQLEMKTSNGPRTRVRVGPFDSLTDADRAAKKIRALGLEAALVRP